MSKPGRRKGSAGRSTNHLPVVLVVVLLAAALIVAAKGLLRKPTNPGDPPEVQLEQALAQKRVIFALFHSTTCIPCKEMERVAAEVMPEFKGRVVFVDVDVYDEANLGLLRRMQIRVIPTTFIFDPTGQSKMFQGVMPRDTLRSELRAALAR